MLKEIAYQLIKQPAAGAEIASAVEAKKKHLLHLYGKGYLDYLVRHEGIQSENSFELKKKLSRPETPRIFKSVKSFTSKIFKAHGGSYNLFFKGENSDIKVEALEYLNNHFGKGLGQWEYMREVWHDLLYEDGTGLLMVCLPAKEAAEAKPFVDYFPIECIHDLGVEGKNIIYVIIKSKGKINNEEKDFYTVIDADEAITYWVDNDTLREVESSRVKNIWGEVPAVQVSTMRYSGDKNVLKKVPITEVLGTADKLLDTESDHTICIKLHQHPLFVSLPVTCPSCNGSKEAKIYNKELETWEEGQCVACGGQGNVAHWKRDMSQGITVPLPLPNPDGSFPDFNLGKVAEYVTPDLDSLAEQREEIRLYEQHIEKGTLGTEGLLVLNPKEETATGKEIDLDPANTTLDGLSYNGETVHERLVYFMLKAIYPEKFEKVQVHYGRNYYLRKEKDIFEEMKDAKTNGAPQAVLMELQRELIMTRFKNSDRERDRALLLLDVEVLPTFTLAEVANLPFVDNEDKTFKAYFNDIVEDFEATEGSVLTYEDDKDYQTRIKDIKAKFKQIYDSYAITIPEGQASPVTKN